MLGPANEQQLEGRSPAKDGGDRGFPEDPLERDSARLVGREGAFDVFQTDRGALSLARGPLAREGFVASSRKASHIP